MTIDSSEKNYRVTGNYGGKTADSRRKERRNHLLETGIRLLGSQGYAATSLNSVCSEAGLTKRYFYESFESVDDLVIQAYNRVGNELQIKIIESISSQTTPRAMITNGFQAFFEYIQSNPERGRLFLIEALSVNQSRGELFGSAGGDVPEFLMKTAVSRLREKSLPKPVLKVMAQGAVGAAIMIGQSWVARDYGQPVEELIQGASEIAFGISDRLGVDLDG